MDLEHRKGKRRIRRILESRKGRKLAVAGLVGMGGVGGVAKSRTAEPRQPQFDDPVKEAVAATMVERLAGRGWDLPNLDHERVDHFVDRFSNDPDMRERFEGFLIRSGRYVPMISEKLEDRDMPHDLIFLALIESGFDPTAYSNADASGLWQFIAETGRRYGLRVDGTVDERNHPEKATEAALDYLTELHDRFGSWYLAAAAYNTGENRVGRIMREVTGSEMATSEEDYYKIWDRLPKETRDYVPLMIAAARIAKDPATYGFDHLIPEQPLSFAEVEVPAETTLDELAEHAGADPEELRELNPHLTNDVTPDDLYTVRVPEGTGERVTEALASGESPETELTR